MWQCPKYDFDIKFKFCFLKNKSKFTTEILVYFLIIVKDRLSYGVFYLQSYLVFVPYFFNCYHVLTNPVFEVARLGLSFSKNKLLQRAMKLSELGPLNQSEKYWVLEILVNVNISPQAL